MRSPPVTVPWTCSLMNRSRVGKYLLRGRTRLADLGEELAQALDGLADVDGDGLGGDAEGLRDLVIARLLLPAEQKHLALATRQRIYRLLDRRRGLPGGELLVRIG